MAARAPEDLEAWLALAASAARKAGRLLLRARSRRTTVARELGRDVKLDMDRESEDCILRTLRAKSDFAILAEESGRSGAGREDGTRWLVDPLDGSMNYLRGIPLCCVSIGLWHAGEPLLGAIHDFDRDELFTGIVGRGAQLNGEPIHASAAQREAQAILATGFPVGMDFSASSLARFVGQVRRYRKIRMLGSAALSTAYVAAGRADLYFERDIKLWDVAAGIAIVLAAGGAVRRLPSAHPDALTVYAAAPRLPIPDFVAAGACA